MLQKTHKLSVGTITWEVLRKYDRKGLVRSPMVSPDFFFSTGKFRFFIYRVMPALHQGGRYYAYVGLGDTFKIALRGYE